MNNDLTPEQQEAMEAGSLENALSLLTPRKRKLYESLQKAFGNVSQACDMAGVARRTYYIWTEQDPYFRELVRGAEFKESRTDWVESKLMSRIAANDTIAIIFYLKTQAKDRGYVEKQLEKRPDNFDRTPSWFDHQAPPPPQALPGVEDAHVISETKNPEK